MHGDLHYRCRGIGLAQQVVQARERLIAAGEIGIARRHALEQPRPRPRGDRAALRRRQDAVAALLRVVDTDEIGEDVRREQPFRQTVFDP